MKRDEITFIVILTLCAAVVSGGCHHSETTEIKEDFSEAVSIVSAESQESKLSSVENKESENSDKSETAYLDYDVTATYQGEELFLDQESKVQLFERTREAIANNSFQLDLDIPSDINETTGKNSLCITIKMDSPKMMTVSSEKQSVSDLLVLINDEESYVVCDGQVFSLPGDYKDVFISYIESLLAEG